MIALKQELPLSCFQCPCLYTLRADMPMNKDIMRLFRICNVNKKLLVGPIIYSEGDEVPKEWMDFPIPEWCPWIEIDGYNSKRKGW